MSLSDLTPVYNETFVDVDNLNIYLLANSYNPGMIDYLRLIHNKFYPVVNLILLNELGDHIDSPNAFSINAKLYYKYKNMNDKKFNYENYKPTSNNIKTTLKRSGLSIENNDYRMLRSEQLRNQGGFSTINEYMLKPKAFKKLLIDIDNHSVRIMFIDYYLFLEEVIKYFDNFQQLKNLDIIKKQKEMLACKDFKIDNLEIKINKQSEQIDKLEIKIDKQSEQIDKLVIKFDKIIDQNAHLEEEVRDTRHHLKKELKMLTKIFESI
jgi:uncharacterized coiled-coil protein SlyX